MSIQAYIAMAVLALMTGSGVFAGCEHKRADGLQAQVAAAQACTDAVAAKPGAKAPAEVCAPAIAAAALTAARSAACDQALASANGFGVQSACSAPVKRLVAERDAARSDTADLQAQLTLAHSDQAGAIARAEVRGQAQAERKAHADAALAAAPRDHDGNAVCDAGCLRERFEGPVSGPSP
ncbi:MAG TPA: hypothetical protein VG960_00335 [Caulobacteraceae bacterium]|nr:hypothetical protein [Caulobacteraceae bacterium]